VKANFVKRILILQVIGALFLIPLIVSSQDVRSLKDIPYIEGGGYKQQLDLYLPATKGFPAIIFIHGGSLTSGDRKGDPKEEPYEAIASHFIEVGIGCAVISYRLGTQNKWPAMADDVATAFAWIKKNIGRYGGLSNKIFLVGHSSGAYLTAVVSSDEKYLRKFGYALSDISGCVPMGALLHPCLDLEELSNDKLNQFFERARQRDEYESIFQTPEIYRDADPYYHINKNMPPFLVLIAEAEQINPPILGQANQFVEEMKKMGQNARIEILKDRKHYTALQKMTEPNDPTFNLIVDFIRSN
jgi:acetyl esterase/lipase